MFDKNSLPEIDKRIITDPEIYEHIPVACHYDKDTLLTKEGHLIQIIEVTGYEDKTQDLESYDLRDSVRKALVESIPSDQYAIYLHTIRSRKNLMPHGLEPFGFADSLNKKWCKKNNWDKQLANTLYISIIRQASNVPLAKTLNFGFLKRHFVKFFQQANKDLADVTNKISSKLSRFGAKKLTTVQTNKGYCSEPLMFYHNLIHLRQKQTPMPIRDLSEYLGSMQLFYNFNSMEIQDEDGSQFAAIFSLKEYIELPTSVLDMILQLGTQFVITQAIYFVPASQAKKAYEDQYELLKLTNVPLLIESSGLDEFFKKDGIGKTSFCQQQITILIHSDDQKFFADKIKQTTKALHDVGLPAIIEDFQMPKLFWAQLPGNLKYLKNTRLTYIPSSQIAGLSSIHHYLSGSFKGSKWGPPITLLRSDLGTPYFFNFHNRKGNGNTIMIGPKGVGKTVIRRFLLAQACKLNTSIIYLDLEGTSKRFIESIGGKYLKFTATETNNLKINPFDINLYEQRHDLFKEWLLSSIYEKGRASPQYEEFFFALAQNLLNHNDTTNSLEKLAEIIKSSNEQNLIDGLNQFVNNNYFKNYITDSQDNLSALELDNIIGIDFSDFWKDELFLKSFFGVFLQKLLKLLDGKPTIITLSRALLTYRINSFYPVFGKWLQTLMSHNAIAIMGISREPILEKNKDFNEHYQLFGTKIFFSDKFADKNFKKTFNLTDDELYKIRSYDKSRRIFMLMQDNDTVMLSLHLGDLKEEVDILGANENE